MDSTNIACSSGLASHRRHCEKLREICMVDTIYKVIELVGR